MELLILQLGTILLGLFLAGRLAFQVRLSIIPLYIVAGILLRPYVPFSELIGFLSLMGVIFLLFYMGLDFSLGAFLSQWRSFLGVGTIDLVINFSLGLVLGALLGWTLIETLFLAGIIYMTSSAIVAKSLIDLKRVANPETEIILGIMVYEDLVIALYLAVLSGFALSGRVEGWSQDLDRTPLCSGFFRVVSPPGLCSGLAIGLRRDEPRALGGHWGVHVRPANERDSGKSRVHELFLPFPQLFAALFFVSFGMHIEYEAFPSVIGTGLVFTVVAVAGKILAGFLAGLWQRLPWEASLNIGFALVPKGEFSIILAVVAAKIARPEIHIEPLLAFFVLIMSVIGPTLMKESYTIINLIERMLGRSIPPSQTDLAGGH